MMSISGLSFVITGASNGIGAGTAKLAAQRGARVVVSDVSDAAGEQLIDGGSLAWRGTVDVLGMQEGAEL
jgi:NAD(P)-dependent dehydrogenase (short-subunit alcohol dehydrogenase family)